MSIHMPAELQWLSYLAGSSWPQGDEDTLFALAEDWHRASDELGGLVADLRAACDTALRSYSGDGAEQIKAQFDKFFEGDQSIAEIAKGLRQLGDSVRDCGTQIEYAKLQIIITLIITAAEIAYALATMWGAFAVPVIQAEAAGIIQAVGRALASRLAARAVRIADMPLWKLAGVAALREAGIGFGQELLIQGIQVGKGHRNGIDVGQLAISTAVSGVSGAVAAPVGHYIGKGLGKLANPATMTWWKAGGMAIAAGVPSGVVGALGGYVANGAITGDWTFDPNMILGGVGGGLVGGVHGVSDHLQNTRAALATDGSAPRIVELSNVSPSSAGSGSATGPVGTGATNPTAPSTAPSMPPRGSSDVRPADPGARTDRPTGAAPTTPLASSNSGTSQRIGANPTTTPLGDAVPGAHQSTGGGTGTAPLAGTASDNSRPAGTHPNPSPAAGANPHTGQPPAAARSNIGPLTAASASTAPLAGSSSSTGHATGAASNTTDPIGPGMHTGQPTTTPNPNSLAGAAAADAPVPVAQAAPTAQPPNVSRFPGSSDPPPSAHSSIPMRPTDPDVTPARATAPGPAGPASSSLTQHVSSAHTTPPGEGMTPARPAVPPTSASRLVPSGEDGSRARPALLPNAPDSPLRVGPTMHSTPFPANPVTRQSLSPDTPVTVRSTRSADPDAPARPPQTRPDRRRAEIERRQLLLDAASAALERRERALRVQRTETTNKQRALLRHTGDRAERAAAWRDVRISWNDLNEIEQTLRADRENLVRQQADLDAWREQAAEGRPRPLPEPDAFAPAAPSITPPDPPPGSGGSADPQSVRAHTRAVEHWWRTRGSQWWQDLRFAELEPADQLALVTEFAGLRNGDGIPAEVRDALNRTYIARELARSIELGRPSALSSVERHRLRNLREMLINLYNADLQARFIARKTGIEQPPVHLLRFDPDAFGGYGSAVMSYGNVDTAESVSWYIPGVGTSIATMHTDVINGMNLYAATKRADPELAVATVVWVDYKTPGGDGRPWTMLRATRPTLAIEGADRLRAALHAFDEARRIGADGAPAHRMHVFAHSYGSVTASYAAHNGRLAPVIESLTLLGSPGAGPVRHASEYGLAPGRVFALLPAEDPVARLGAPAPGMRGSLFDAVQHAIDIGHGISPASKEFGAIRGRSEYPERYTGVTAHRQQFEFTRDFAGNWVPSESLDNMARIATGNYDRVVTEAHRPPLRARTWKSVYAGVPDPAGIRLVPRPLTVAHDGSVPHPRALTRAVTAPPAIGPTRPDRAAGGESGPGTGAAGIAAAVVSEPSSEHRSLAREALNLLRPNAVADDLLHGLMSPETLATRPGAHEDTAEDLAHARTIAVIRERARDTTTRNAAWWASLDTEHRRALLETYPHQLGNADGIPPEIRDKANRRAIAYDLAALRGREVPLTAEQRVQLRNLELTVGQLWQIERDAGTLPGSPPVRVLSFDATAFHGKGRIVLTLGDITTATSVSWHIGGFGTKLSRLRHRWNYLYDHYTETLAHAARRTASSEGFEAASVLWFGYEHPTGVGEVVTPHLAIEGSKAFARDLAAFHALREQASGNADLPHNHVFAHSYGSTTVSHAAAHARLAHELSTITLLGSPGAGPVARADEFGIGPRVYVVSSDWDLVTKFGVGRPGFRNLMSFKGLGVDPAVASFGAKRLHTGFPSGLTTLNPIDPHRRYLRTIVRDGNTQPLASLQATAAIAAGSTETLSFKPLRSNAPGAIDAPSHTSGPREGSTAADGSRPLSIATDPGRPRSDHRIGAMPTESESSANHRSNDCGPQSLRRLVELTGSPVVRLPEHPVGITGMSRGELEDAAGASLHSYRDHDTVARHLLQLGAGATALIVDTYRGPTDIHGVGAHAYLLTNDNGHITVLDPGLDRHHGFPPRTARALDSTHAILYAADGIPVSPAHLPADATNAAAQLVDLSGYRLVPMGSAEQGPFPALGRIFAEEFGDDIGVAQLRSSIIDEFGESWPIHRDRLPADITERHVFLHQLEDLRTSWNPDHPLAHLLLGEAARMFDIRLAVVDAHGAGIVYGEQDRPMHILVHSADGRHFSVAEPADAGPPAQPPLPPLIAVTAGNDNGYLYFHNHVAARMYGEHLEALRRQHFDETGAGFSPQQLTSLRQYAREPVPNYFLRLNETAIAEHFALIGRARAEGRSLRDLLAIPSEATAIPDPGRHPGLADYPSLRTALADDQRLRELLLKADHRELAEYYGTLDPTIEHIEKHIENIDAAFQLDRPLPHALRAVRGVHDIASLLDGAGNRLGTRDPHMLVGTIQRDPTFLSTSLADEYTTTSRRNFHHRFEFRIPAGTRALWLDPSLSAHAYEECEILLPRGITYRIDSVTDTGTPDRPQFTIRTTVIATEPATDLDTVRIGGRRGWDDLPADIRQAVRGYLEAPELLDAMASEPDAAAAFRDRSTVLRRGHAIVESLTGGSDSLDIHALEQQLAHLDRAARNQEPLSASDRNRLAYLEEIFDADDPHRYWREIRSQHTEYGELAAYIRRHLGGAPDSESLHRLDPEAAGPVDHDEILRFAEDQSEGLSVAAGQPAASSDSDSLARFLAEQHRIARDALEMLGHTATAADLLHVPVSRADIEGVRLHERDLATAEAAGTLDYTREIAAIREKARVTTVRNASWWQSLDAEQRRALLNTHPHQLGNADGLPPDVRDKANRRAIAYDLVGLRNQEGPPTAEQQIRLRNLNLTIAQLLTIQYDALPLPGSPPIRILSYDADAFHGKGRIVMTVGDITTAESVSWHVGGFGTKLSRLAHRWDYVHNHYLATLAADPHRANPVRRLEPAAILWFGYEHPTTPDKVVVPHLARDGARYFARDIAAYHALREQVLGNATTLRNHVFAHSYGSTTVAFAAAHRQLAHELSTLTLLGSPGAGPVTNAEEFGIGSNVYVISSGWDFVTKYGTGRSGLRHLLPVKGLGIDPATENFGAQRLRTGYPSGLTTANPIDPHRRYLRSIPKDGAETLLSLTNLGAIAADNHAALSPKSPRPSATTAGHTHPYPPHDLPPRPPTPEPPGELGAEEARIGATATTPTEHIARQANDCGPRALLALVELTRSAVVRVPEQPTDAAGMSQRELEKAAGAPLHRFTDHQDIADQLLHHGPGTTALVVDTYRGPTDAHGVGAHAYLITNRPDGIVVIDPSRNHTAPLRAKAVEGIGAVHAILYTADGTPIPATPTRPTADQAAPESSRNVRRFQTDAEAAEYGSRHLRELKTLPPQVRLAVHAYERETVVNSILRTHSDPGEIEPYLDRLQRNAEIVDLLDSDYPDLSDAPSLAQAKAQLITEGASPETDERIQFIDEILNHPDPGQRWTEIKGEWDHYYLLMAYYQQYFGDFGPEVVQRQIDLLDQATRRQLRLPETVQVFRALPDIHYLVDSQGTPLADRDPENLIGTVQTERGYLSTSLTATPLVNHPYVMKLAVPRGSLGLYIGEDGVVRDQQEVLLARNTEYRITAVEREPNGTVVLVGEVLAPGASTAEISTANSPGRGDGTAVLDTSAGPTHGSHPESRIVADRPVGFGGNDLPRIGMYPNQGWQQHPYYFSQQGYPPAQPGQTFYFSPQGYTQQPNQAQHAYPQYSQTYYTQAQPPSSGSVDISFQLGGGQPSQWAGYATTSTYSAAPAGDSSTPWRLPDNTVVDSSTHTVVNRGDMTYILDSAMQPKYAHGSLKPPAKYKKRGVGHLPHPVGFIEGVDHRGHMIPEAGAGEQADVNVPENIFAQQGNANTSAKKKWENAAIKYARNNPGTKMLAKILDRDSTGRPTRSAYALFDHTGRELTQFTMELDNPRDNWTKAKAVYKYKSSFW
ncbi:alpha/beta hydrolase [Nocardia sp. CDC159]|uniref:Alpha/beta hydrolase n=1 Tax=Nocardia pulmonis TaxID=2951408 RepID=A0A9X2E9C6_9NOCA|nr:MULTISPECIES: alpha/beta hydrolase [Nocardia]MCM6776076.1 alpha/beta hydrolase [Nocardia pulmonis]MCM6788597.1 alpha/beta hydrolase [Nocardia sp. CDC159]